MSYTVKQPNLFARIGTGFGQGLAEQLPKEIERNRLASGLQKFEQESANLTPIQQLARLSSIPGITPQMIQSFSELAKQQGIRNAFSRGSMDRPSFEPGRASSAIHDMEFNPAKPGQQPKQQGEIPQQVQSSTDMPITVNNFGQPQVVPTNPLRDEAVPKAPWSAERRKAEVGAILDENPWISLPEAQSIAADNEARDLAQPIAQQEKDAYLQKVQDAVDNKFTKALETRLQKKEEGIYGDITGDNLINLKRGLEKELRLNPKASVDDVVDKWSKKALEFSKAKKELQTLSNRGIIDTIFKSAQTTDKLRSAQKIYKDANNLEEFYDLLRTIPNKKEGINGFGMSSQGAAQFAFPRSKPVSEYVNKVKIGLTNAARDSERIAEELFSKNIIERNDSLLAIAGDLRRKYPDFNQTAFFKYLTDNQDELPLTPRQQKELITGAGDVLPNWGDIWVLPERK